jgi:unsaturated chondroitin disaccharide hydrolase
MLEIADQLNENEKELYVESAINIMKAIEQRYGNWDTEQDGLLMGGRGSYHSKEPNEGKSLIFGEYYYVEAILRLVGKSLSIW